MKRIKRQGRWFVVERARPCRCCGKYFEPRRQDVRSGRGFYCSVLCGRRGDAKARIAKNDDRIKQLMNCAATAPQNKCVVWPRFVNSAGYGLCRYMGRRWFSHRLSYVLNKGEIPPGMCVCHRCDVPGCYNPKHLFLGTINDNNVDAARKGRTARGQRNGSSVLTERIVRSIRKSTLTGRQLAKKHGVSPANISIIKNRKTWSHVDD